MKFARGYMIINGLLLVLYGAYCIYNPQFVADITSMTVSSTALTEIRAMYGGLEFALGVFFVAMALKPRHMEAALIAMAMCFGGLCTTRALGIFLAGGDDYNNYGFAYEFISTFLALFGLIKVRKALRENAV